MKDGVATPPQISPNLPKISSNLLKKCRFSRNPPQISSNSKIQNSILAISLLNNTNKLSVKEVKHNFILGHHGSISLYCLVA